MASTVQLTYICSKASSWRDVDFVQECGLVIKSALSFTAVAFREISSTTALMKLLLPIKIYVAVCGLQATRRPTITDLLLQNCVIQVSLLRGVWNSERRCTGRLPPRNYLTFLTSKDDFLKKNLNASKPSNYCSQKV